MPKMTEDEFKNVVGQEIRQSIGFFGDQVAIDRAKAIDYYLGRPFGNEQEGRSQVVETIVRDTVEWRMPALMKIFAAGDQIIEVKPRGKGDEEASQQATDMANYVLMEDNDGVMIIHDALKDGEIQKVGAAEVSTVEKEIQQTTTHTGLTEDELALLYSDDDEGIETIAYSQRPDMDPVSGQPVTYHDVTIRRVKKERRVEIHGIAPEDLLISPYARSGTDTRMIGYRFYPTKSDLVALGYDKDEVDALPSDATSRLWTDQQRRFFEQSSLPNLSTLDKTMHEVDGYRLYMQCDFDGDGIAEWRRIVAAGGSGKDGSLTIFENEEVDGPRIATWTPTRIPHVFYGLSEADMTMDLQFTQSTVRRQMLDNMYNITSGRAIITESGSTESTIDDWLANRPNGVIRARTADAVTPVTSTNIIRETSLVIEQLEAIKEKRTGITAYNQGTDANTLNKTKGGMDMIMGASQQRTEMIARMFAEQFMKPLGKYILKELIKHQDKPRTIRLRDKWVDIDPRAWNADMDVSVNVGIGYGSRDQQVGLMNNLLQIDAQLLKAGLAGRVVTEVNVYQKLKKLCEASGLKTVELYYTDPTGLPPPEPKPDPAMVEAQANIAATQAETQATIQSDQIKTQAKIAGDQQKNAAKIELQAQKQQTDAALRMREQDMTMASGGFGPPPGSNGAMQP